MSYSGREAGPNREGGQNSAAQPSVQDLAVIKHQMRTLAKALVVDWNTERDGLHEQVEDLQTKNRVLQGTVKELSRDLGFASQLEKHMGGSSHAHLGGMLSELSQARSDLKTLRRDHKAATLESLRLTAELERFQFDHLDCRAGTGQLQEKYAKLVEEHEQCQPKLERALQAVNHTLLEEISVLAAEKGALERQLNQFQLHHSVTRSRRNGSDHHSDGPGISGSEK